MRILISTIGTAGDLHPFIGVGVALRARGHDVTMLANPYFRPRIERAGLAFEGIGDAADYLRFVQNGTLVDDRRSMDFVFRELLIGTFAAQVVGVRRAAAAARPDIVLAHHIAFGVHAACEVLRLPLAIGVLAPIFWLSEEEELHLPFLPFPRARGFWHRVQRRAVGVISRWRYDGEISRCRRAAGASPLRGAFQRVARGESGAGSDELTPVLALWSRHFRPVRPDDPAGGAICGFSAWDDPAGVDAVRLKDLEEWMQAGERPVVVTLGSSVSHHGAELYRIAAKACEQLGRRALLLTGGDDASVSTPMLRVERGAPYAAIFPHAAAIVHHAGIGTTASALRAGVPSAIIPHANDEFDNANRVQRLKAGSVVERKRLTPKTMIDALAGVLNDAKIQAAAARLGGVLRAEDGAFEAARRIETLATAAVRNSAREAQCAKAEAALA